MMDARIGSVPPVSRQETRNVSQMESLNRSVDEISVKVQELEQKLDEVEHFYSNSSTKVLNTPKEKYNNFKKRQQDAASREAAAAQRMKKLMHEFGVILQKITQHKWAGPFMQPVDVVGLGLHDYYKVIEKPMDFSTIKSKMDAKDGTGYKHVREMCADVRLIFKNAMLYNDDRDDVHVMAKTLLDKFEREWLGILPLADKEDLRRKQEEMEAQQDEHLAREVTHAKMARDLSVDLDNVDKHLEELKDMILQNSRKMTTDEKKRLGTAIARLSPDDINKALEIIAQNDPTFQTTGETVEIDIDAQSESTLWKLKLLVKDSLQAQMKSSTSTGGNNNGENNKRRREIPEVVAKTSQKKSKKV